MVQQEFYGVVLSPIDRTARNHIPFSRDTADEDEGKDDSPACVALIRRVLVQTMREQTNRHDLSPAATNW